MYQTLARFGIEPGYFVAIISAFEAKAFDRQSRPCHFHSL